MPTNVCKNNITLHRMTQIQEVVVKYLAIQITNLKQA